MRLSPQARAFFSEQCVAANVPQLELLKWCRTRWSSVDDMIVRLLGLRPVCASDHPLIGDGGTLRLTICSRLFKNSPVLRMTATRSLNSRKAANTWTSSFRMQNGNNWSWSTRSCRCVCVRLSCCCQDLLCCHSSWSRKSPGHSIISRVTPNRLSPGQYPSSNGCRHVGSR